MIHVAICQMVMRTRFRQAVLRQNLIGARHHWISSGCSPLITVMEPANLRNLNNRTHCRQLYWSRIRFVFVDR
jgi:hypothetical protein